MQKEKIGFVGCYSHDVILLLAKVLSFAGKQVLLEDRNAVHTLAASVPVPEELSGKSKVAEYDGIFYTDEVTAKETEAMFDLLLVDFGFWGWREELESCTRLVVVTDMLPHHLKRLQKLMLPKDAVRECIVRDAVSGKCSGEREVKAFLEMFPNREEFFLPPDVKDIKNRCVCETLCEYSLKRASPELRELVLYMAGTLCPEFTEKELRRRMRRGERRQYL